MKAPDGTIITQFELHDLEDVSEIKMDLLSIEGADKIQTCLELLIKDGYIKEYSTLRETYEHALGVYTIERSTDAMWDMVNAHKVYSLFQMEKDSGYRGIQLTHPRTVDDLSALNSVIRLMASEKGAESPLDKYARFRSNPTAWDMEMRQYGLTDQERQLLHDELDISNGLSITQEQFMKLVQLPECGGFDLQWSDRLRKSIAKKNPKEYEALTEEFFHTIKEKGCSETFCRYVWNIEIALSRGYGFNAAHTLSYSIIGLQEMNLAYKYPIVYWNTANLIVDSGGVQYFNEEDIGDAELNIEQELSDDELQVMQEEIEPDEEWAEAANTTITQNEKKKNKNKTIDYGRVASIIGKMKQEGINISPPDINQSSFTFTPKPLENKILYGMRGIARISTELVNAIINNRPYISLIDFLEKNHTNKLQTLNLIKSGAFDAIEKKPREEIMHNYLASIADQKQTVNLRNMQMLINKDLIPEKMTFYGKLFLFNKFLKECKNGEYYDLNDAAINFLDKHFEVNLTSDGTKILQKTWDNVYKKSMKPMGMYLKEHMQEMLDALNNSLYKEIEEKYGSGNISQWEMESISFYYHDHELQAASNKYANFFDLPEEPIVDYSFENRQGQEIKIYKLYQIIGTVIDKDKIKNTVTLLTPTGVVQVKVYKNQYAGFDKQISYKDAEGVKHVLEKSWFSRGTKLMVQGIRREDAFIPKKTKQSVYPIISKITGIDENGNLTLQYDKIEVDK